ncbi:MAG TPA: dTDP-4-dehydrorhamnose reductase [Methylomirabilota bacterium]|nr:dTDP-4-dehydrorhamnose reductase [Methylomirabilota bacterium]
MRALVIGASGQVGAALVRRLAARGATVTGTHARVARPDTRPLDLTDTAAAARLIAEVAPDWVFCPAGLTAVDHCEAHAEEAFTVNRDAPAAAARAAARLGAGFVYFSTEYVFDGTAGLYAEDDRVNPLSIYGRSKAEGERAVREANPRSLVVRTSVVYGPEPQGKNFVYQLLARGRRDEPMRAPGDQRSSPTYNEDLAAATVEAAERGLDGVIHLAGPEVMDRHAFALIVCRTFGLDPALLARVSTAELEQPARRPPDAGLRIDRARALLATRMRGPKEGLEAMRATLEEGLRG